MTNERRVECPDCLGKGGISKDYMGGHLTMDCRRCGKTGRIPVVMFEWIAKGKSLTGMRQNMDRSLREMAKQMGIEPLALHDAEHGYVDPTSVWDLPGWEFP